MLNKKRFGHFRHSCIILGKIFISEAQDDM